MPQPQLFSDARGGWGRRSARALPPVVADAPMLVEPLEPRALLTFAWTAEEVYLSELVNRARANPTAEGLRLGVDLTADLTPGELARLVPQEPLALNQFLTAAARAHSLDMAVRDFFDHVNPDGLDPTQRAQNAGYDGTAGENIGAGQSSIDAVHLAWLQSVEHRKNILSLYENFTSTFHYDEFGPGFAFTDIGPFFDYYTEEFGVQAAPAQVFLLGVAFTDLDANNFYGIGEGLSGVRIDVSPIGLPSVVVASYTTDAAGNYQLALAPGSYDVTFVHQPSGQRTTRSVTIADVNVKVDVTRAQINQGADMTFVSAAGDRVIVGSGSNGRMSIAGFNVGGRPLVYQQTQSGWVVRDIVAASGSPEVAGKVITWVDPKDNLVYAAAHSEQGLILFTQSATGQWTYRNLSTSVAGAVIPGSEITAFTGVDGLVRIAGLQSNGDMVLFYQDGSGSAGNYGWGFANLADHLRANGQPVPALAGELTSYVTAWNGLNIAALDGAGNIQSIWWAPGLIFWQGANLSAITGAPRLVGNVAAYLTPWGGINLAGTNSAGEISVTWWVPGFGSDWRNSNLTQLFAGPTLASASVTAYVSTWGGLNIAGLDGGGHVIIYWWAPGMDPWQVTPISDAIPGAMLPVGALTGHATIPGSLNIVGTTDQGHLMRYHWEIGGIWQAEDITAAL